MAELPPPLEAALDSAIESLLENESLTADLEDDAASALLDWGMARAQKIHLHAAELPDFERYLSDQMRAIRKMMRAVNGWISTRAEKDQAGHLAALEEVLAYIGGNAAPEQQTAFLTAHLPEPPPEFIASLRSFCETL